MKRYREVKTPGFYGYWGKVAGIFRESYDIMGAPALSGTFTGKIKMIPSKRKTAKDLGEKRYNTGKPCANGHLADRYTTSGACVDCLTEANGGTRRPVGVVASEARRTALEGLVPVRLRAHELDVKTLLDTAAALTMSRHPSLVRMDVVGLGRGTKPAGGTLLYVVNVDPADIQMLRDMQNAMLTARGPDMEAERRRIFGGLAAQVEGSRDNGETEWKFT